MYIFWQLAAISFSLHHRYQQLCGGCPPCRRPGLHLGVWHPGFDGWPAQHGSECVLDAEHLVLGGYLAYNRRLGLLFTETNGQFAAGAALIALNFTKDKK